MHDIPRQTLQQIVATYGREVLSDPRRCRALLMDFCGAYRGEINLLEIALRENVARDLAEAPEGVPQSLVVARLAQRLQDAYYLPAEAARWAVDTCLTALEGAAPETAEGIFSSDVPCAVLARGWLEADDAWREIGRTPGRVIVPPDVAVGISTRLELGTMAALAQDLRSFGAVQRLDLSYAELDDGQLERLAELPGLLNLDLARTATGERALFSLAAHPQLLSLNLWGCEHVTDAGLTGLEALQQLEWLELGHCSRVSGQAAASIRNLSRLTYLGLSATRFGDTGLRQLTGLRLLRSIDLSDTLLSGSGLSVLATMPDLGTLNLQNCVRLRPETLIVLREMLLTDLALGGCGLLTDAALVHVRPLRGLTCLSLERLEISDVGVLYLTDLIALSRLDMSWTRVGDAGLARLCALRGLRELLLSGTKVTDAGLARLEQLPGLVELNLSGTALTDAGLRSLVAVPSLEVLDLENTSVHDAGLVHLGEMPNLRSLYLGGTAITDLGLDLIARLTSVKEVDVTQCPRVTERGASTLREAGISVTW